MPSIASTISSVRRCRSLESRLATSSRMVRSFWRTGVKSSIVLVLVAIKARARVPPILTQKAPAVDGVLAAHRAGDAFLKRRRRLQLLEIQPQADDRLRHLGARSPLARSARPSGARPARPVRCPERPRDRSRRRRSHLQPDTSRRSARSPEATDHAAPSGGWHRTRQPSAPPGSAGQPAAPARPAHRIVARCCSVSASSWACASARACSSSSACWSDAVRSATWISRLACVSRSAWLAARVCARVSYMRAWNWLSTSRMIAVAAHKPTKSTTGVPGSCAADSRARRAPRL